MIHFVTLPSAMLHLMKVAFSTARMIVITVRIPAVRGVLLRQEPMGSFARSSATMELITTGMGTQIVMILPAGAIMKRSVEPVVMVSTMTKTMPPTVMILSVLVTRPALPAVLMTIKSALMDLMIPAASSVPHAHVTLGAKIAGAWQDRHLPRYRT